jgi:hypothetical protein
MLYKRKHSSAKSIKKSPDVLFSENPFVPLKTVDNRIQAGAIHYKRYCDKSASGTQAPVDTSGKVRTQ